MAENPIKWLKNRLKMYLIRIHGYNEGFYIDKFLKSVVTETVKDIIEPIIMLGIIGYITLYGLTIIIPATAIVIKLGTSALGIFQVFLFVGIILTVIRNLYRKIELEDGTNE
jgi:large-conductance mechanosensitive channel